MRLPGLKRLVQSGRWLRSRLELGGLILGYHRVAEAGASAYGLCVSPANFAEQIEVLHRHCRPVSVLGLAEGLDDGSLPPRAVAVTFDDGYADVLDKARPWLERYGVPATVFVVTGRLGHKFWWDELADALMGSKPPKEHLHLRVGGETVVWELDDPSVGQDGPPEDRSRLASDLYRRLLPLAPEEQCRVLSQIQAWAGDSSVAPETGRSLTSAEVQQLAGDLVDIGAHTVTHPLLAAQPTALQRSEIRDSKSALEALLDRPIIGFSYPNGSTSPTTRALVREAGFSYACGSQPDVARRSSHRYQLPRFWVPDFDGEAFGRWLHPWLRG